MSTIDYSCIKCRIEDAEQALRVYEESGELEHADQQTVLLAAITSALLSIAYSLGANHLGDEYP